MSGGSLSSSANSVPITRTVNSKALSNDITLNATDIGLSNVTNDAQLKRAAGDINSFDSKSAPISTDVLIIEDAENGYAKKKVTLGNISGLLGGSPSSNALTKYGLSSPPQVVLNNGEVSILYSDVSNASIIPQVFMQVAGGTDVSNLDIDFDTADEANYEQEDATNGTDFVNGEIQLHPTLNDNNVKVLLQGNGTNNSTNIKDYAGNHTITVGGNVKITTTSPKYGNGCIDLAGSSGDNLKLSLDADINGWENSSWVAECWVRADALTGNNCVFAAQNSAYNAGYTAWLVQTVGSNLTFFAGTTGSSHDIASAAVINAMSTGTWYHVAVVYDAVDNELEVYFDGIRKLQYTGVTALAASREYLIIGEWVGGGGTFNGQIDDFRVTIYNAANHPHYTANFTPPTAEFSNVAFPTAQAYYVYTKSALSVYTGQILDFDSLTITSAEPTNTSIKCLVSWNGGTTWQYYSGGNWLNSSLANLQSEGMTVSALQTAFTNLTPPVNATELRFAFDLATTDGTVTPSINGLNIVYDELASYAPAVLGSYTSAKAEFGVKTYTDYAKFKNLTGSTQTIIPYIYTT